jgi:hypothetical protein
LELVDVDFAFVNIRMFVFPQSLQYVKFSYTMLAARMEGATPAVDFLKSERPDILVEVGITDYEDVFFRFGVYVCSSASVSMCMCRSIGCWRTSQGSSITDIGG